MNIGNRDKWKFVYSAAELAEGAATYRGAT